MRSRPEPLEAGSGCIADATAFKWCSRASAVRPHLSLSGFTTSAAWDFRNVASLRHAEKAPEAGADGLGAASCAGAGGQAGWINGTSSGARGAGDVGRSACAGGR